MDFKKIIFEWFEVEKRNLPWRNTSNPYHIWVAEVILQQTRVAQGTGYYYRFIDEFPTVFDLAKASQDRVLKVWQGLGYYTRARNLHASAKEIVSKYNGIIPNRYQELIKIKGLGEYSAGAVASFAFKEPVPAIDGNVYRVIARVFGLFASPYNASGKREFYNLTMDIMDYENPDTFNQALLDFGALQCIPQSPNCSQCPFQGYCYAYRNNTIDALPVKAKRIIPRDRFFTYIIIRCGYSTFIAKRKSKDIWHSLYEFPLIESIKPLSINSLRRHATWKLLFKGVRPNVLHLSDMVKHQLSHQTLHAQFVVVQIKQPTDALLDNYNMVSTQEVHEYSIPRLIDAYLAAEPAAKYFWKPTDS